MRILEFHNLSSVLFSFSYGLAAIVIVYLGGALLGRSRTSIKDSKWLWNVVLVVGVVLMFLAIFHWIPGVAKDIKPDSIKFVPTPLLLGILIGTALSKGLSNKMRSGKE